MTYLDSDFNAPNTRMFKSIGPVEFTTIYFGSGVCPVSEGGHADEDVI